MHLIKTVVPKDNYILNVYFTCGEARSYDFSELIETLPLYKRFLVDEGLFPKAYPINGGDAVAWNEYIDTGAEEIWRNGKPIKSPFDSLMSCGEAAQLWHIDESTLRKSIIKGRLKEGTDVMKFGKQWIITAKAMKREFGPMEGASASKMYFDY